MVGDHACTPLVRIADDLFLKCEFLHPGRSHKARVARALVDEAEQRAGRPSLHERILLERTGGNLGVALALEASARGYALVLVTDPYSPATKRAIASRLGATVIDRGVAYPRARSNGEVIEQMLAERGSRYYYLNQFASPANPRAHELGTGREITSDLATSGYTPDTTVVLVTGMGTGASMSGISRALRRRFARVVTVAVEPPNCDLRRARYGDHEAYGIAVGEPAPFMAVDELDAIVSVTSGQIIEAQRQMSREHGLLVGPSSAANMAALAAARQHPACRGSQRIFVSLLFDRWEDYL